MDRWLWVCPLIGLVGAAVTLTVFGFTWLSALGVAFLFACPAVVIWTMREARASFGLKDSLLDDINKSRGQHG